MASMKLLFVIDSLGSGGAQRQMVSLALGLKDRGHDVEFFVYNPHLKHFASEVEDSGIVIHEYIKRRKFSIGVVVALRKRLIQGRYSLILSFLPTPNFYCEILRCLGSRTPLIVSERNMYPSGRLSVKMCAIQQFHRLANHITVNSETQRSRMVTEFPWMGTRISTIYNGVDLDRFQLTPSCRDEDDGCRKLLALGTIIPRKNLTGLIRGLSQCAEDVRSKVHVTWVGKEGNGDHEYFEDAKCLIKRFNLEGIWTWLGEQTNIAEIIRHHDAIVHPSFREGLPNAICEGLASGRPILASHIGDHATLVSEGENGFLFDPKSPHEIESAISRFVHLPDEKVRQMQLKSRATAERRLSLQKYVETYERLFRRIGSV
jgi:glycosyltransferase involved in cell wall biosynthesis